MLLLNCVQSYEIELKRAKRFKNQLGVFSFLRNFETISDLRI